MSFLADLFQTIVDTAAQTQQASQPRRGNRGLTKVAECTPCEAQAYIDSLRPNAGNKKKSTRKRAR